MSADMTDANNITDWCLETFQTHYKDAGITKEMIFWYVYAILHHPSYLSKYRHILTKGIPRVPLAPDFAALARIGQELGMLHLDYETCEQYPLKLVNDMPDHPRRIVFGTTPDPAGRKTRVVDPSVMVVDSVTVYETLPAIKYTVNGRTPLGWLTWTPKKSAHGIDRAPFRHMTGAEFHEYACRLAYVGVESDRLIAKLAEYEYDGGYRLPPPEPVVQRQATLDGNR